MVEGFLRRVLDGIEQAEARLLVWGLVDGRLSREELSDLIAPLLDEAIGQGVDDFFDGDEVIAALRERGLLFETDEVPYPGFRSRMAETVRLAFRLRQLFPKHAGVDGWQQARTLVADYRFSWRRRRYPKRDLPAAGLIEKAQEILASPLTPSVLEALLERRGSDYRLADFQARATVRILEQVSERRHAGTLVSAGTGSGKTLAFYLPAMSRIGELLAENRKGRPWVKLLAIYPRTELLRDQFAEIYGEARRLDAFLAARSTRKIRIGALFGATPHNSLALKKWDIAGWRRTESGFTCGFMGCPAQDCGGDLVWLSDDIDQGREALVCSSCGQQVSDDELLLTRKRMEQEPPDILFTTTEMLNQRMSDSRSRHLFGLRPHAARPPEMVLLDEVHTYAGTHGAQVGYLLRRWRYLVRAPVSFVGLSATLRDGVRFFARLTGLAEHQVEEITPRRSEMTAEGAEYMLALRGDPVSRASLLSTTIQTIMLMSRALDCAEGTPSRGTFGQRLFAFTDDIDVTNRLFFGVLDAEGRNDHGVADMARHPNGGLAVLRQPMPSAIRERFGQNWSMPRHLGHRLDDRKRVGRTSSQDPGVARGLDVIVATASLEVGFNDPGVGCVIQHKAPRESAQFLQRKGRAGRPRTMRPWTVVVLSDYGRDRLAYQGYEHLFDPELEVRHLPFTSRHIQRMQGVYALIDYLAGKLGSALGNGSIWKSLAQPFNLQGQYASQERVRQVALVEQLANLLKDPDAVAEFGEHLQQALQLSASEISALLWDYPRPLLTTVIPTALRRVSSNWRRGAAPGDDMVVRNSPLPEFAPASLFSDLNLPEIQIRIPPAWEGNAPDLQMMSIDQGMRTFAPGRVSRRFGVSRARVRHWVATEDAGRTQTQVELATFYDVGLLGTWQVRNGNKMADVPVYRPFEIRPVSPPPDVGDTSNGFLDWHSQIVAGERAFPLRVPVGSPWLAVIDGINCFRHAEHASVEVRRFATGSHADIVLKRGEGHRARFEFVDQSRPAALGYSLSVDALRFSLRLPDSLWRQVAASPALERAIRTERYFDAAGGAAALSVVENPFVREWLASIYFAALTNDALIRKVHLQEADAALAAGTASLALVDVLETLFQSPLAIAPDEDSGRNGEGAGQDRLRQDLVHLLQREDVVVGLRELAECLWVPVDASWEPLLRERFVGTVAAAAFEAVCDLCPEIDAGSLIVDVDPGPREGDDLFVDAPGNAEFWISETSPGGNGALEEFVPRYAEDPRRFFSLLSAVLRPNEYALNDAQMGRVLDALSGSPRDEQLIEAVLHFRQAASASASESALSNLRHLLSRRRFVLCHSFLSVLSSRILKAGSTSMADAYLLDALNLWESEEARLGVELDGRSIAYQLSQNDGIDRILSASGLPLPDADHRTAWRFNAIYGLLWRRGREVRRIGLEPYNPFCELPAAERLLVSGYLASQAPIISIQDPDWRERALTQLARHGIATLAASLDRQQELAQALRFFAVNPVEADYLRVFARLSALRWVGDGIEADFEVEEVLQ